MKNKSIAFYPYLSDADMNVLAEAGISIRPPSPHKDEFNPRPLEDESTNKRAEVLRTAEELINGDRARTYGDPEVSFGRIADIWNAMGYRHHVQIDNQPAGRTRATKLDAIDAALILIGMKLSRTIGSTEHLDNWIDIAGYAGLGAELATPKLNQEGEENDG